MTEPVKSRKGIGGPKTPEGKAKVALNALKTGLHATSPQGLTLLAKQMGITHEQILKEVTALYQPQDAIENTFVSRIARCTWRIRLTEAMETRLFEGGGVPHYPGARYTDLIRHERLCDIQLHRAVLALEKRRERLGGRPNVANLKTTENKLAGDPVSCSSDTLSEREFVLPERPVISLVCHTSEGLEEA